jgi:hypothetical protein
MTTMRTRRRLIARAPHRQRWIAKRRALVATVLHLFDHSNASRTYKLVGHEPVPCSMLEVGFGVQVDETFIEGARVSTVFLSVDHNYLAPGNPPIVFETAAFVDDQTVIIDRYATWSDAEAGHERACTELRAWYARTAQVAIEHKETE